MPQSTSSAEPIFVLGILPRSGTNFLYELLCLHPDCVASAPVPEDHLVYGADLLETYVHRISWNWRASWQVEDQKELIYKYLGEGLTTFLNSQKGNKETSKRVVTKTPSVRNLHYFFKLFPKAHLIILVRDGRAVVESNVKSFNSNYETMMRHWAHAAQTILSFDQATKNTDFKYLIVRYEDLWLNLEEELCRIFTFLNLNCEDYDFEAAANLPVRGSSQLRNQKHDSLHWHPIEKTPNFDPILRWQHWTRCRHERFNWIAGEYLTAFGYEPTRYTSPQGQSLIWNRTLDLNWHARDMVRTQIFTRLPKKLRQWLIRKVLKKDMPV